MREERLHEKIKALLALAERGEEGERENARFLMEKLLDKYGLSLDDVVSPDNTPERYWFPFQTKMEKLLLLQIRYMVTNIRSRSYYQDGRKIGLDLTAVQEAEIRFLYDVYRRNLKKELSIFFDGFVQANKLFGELPDNEEPAPVTEEMLRALGMAENIVPATPRKALTG